MSKFIATVWYEGNGIDTEVKFAARAKGIQYVKEQYHRYTHENYEDVSRVNEIDHIHPITEDEYTHSLVNVEPVNEYDLIGLSPIRFV